MSETFWNFEPVLRGYCRMIGAYRDVPRILEWGPGRSTEIIMEELPNAQVLSLEHNPVWFAHYDHLRQKHGEQLDMRLIRHEVWEGELDYYACLPVQLYNREARKFDLVFIDGLQRMNCLTVAGLVCHVGPVLLHDYKRYKMYSPSKMFPVVREYHKYDTLVMCNEPMPVVKP